LKGNAHRYLLIGKPRGPDYDKIIPGMVPGMGHEGFNKKVQMKSRHMGSLIPTLSSVLVAGLAYAAVTFDPATGEGFVGKGDVQYTFGWNNAQLQSNAGSVAFRVASAVVTEVEWICTKFEPQGPELIKEWSRTTTTSTVGVLNTVARVRNQVTGFILNGYAGDATTGTTTTEGRPINTCPAGFWVLTTPAGDPVVVESSSSFEVSANGGGSWTALLEAPVVP